MDIYLFLYIVFGLLNICLFHLFVNTYKLKTGVYLRDDNDVYNTIALFVSGPFGTMILILLGTFLLWLWRKHYRKK
jgi:hypothetical protein